MSFKRVLFLTIVTIGAGLPMFGAVAKNHTKTCGIGGYLLTSSCYLCPPGCYCPGGGTQTQSLDPKDKINHLSEVMPYCARQRETCDHANKDGYGACGKQNNAKIFRCPDEFPLSADGTSSEEDCYFSYIQTGTGLLKKIPNKYITCEAGQYLPQKSTTCTPCKEGEKYYCKAGDTNGKVNLKPSKTQDVGLGTCAGGLVANETKTGCTVKRISCNPGFFLPRGREACEPCRTDGKSVCPGISNAEAGTYRDLGIETCTNGMIPNGSGPTATECVSARTNCPLGQYLPSGSGECVPCKTEGIYYCPGGNFRKYTGEIQGRQKCNPNETPNENGTACVSAIQQCSAGTYLPSGTTTCVACLDGNYYCPGVTAQNNYGSDQGMYTCGTNTKPNDAKTACVSAINAVNMVTCSAGTYLPRGTSACVACLDGNYYCPGITAQGNYSSNQGMYTCGTNTKPNEAKTGCVSAINAVNMVTCSAGTYLPRGTSTCVACSGGNYYCPGITAQGNYGSDQGMYTCGTNTKPNEAKTGCVSSINAVSCAPGTYLAAGESECKECKSGNYYCPSRFEATVPATQDWGLQECGLTQRPSEDKTTCIDTIITVAPGYYLPANQTEQQICLGDNNYCPGGGPYGVLNADQGIFECPFGGITNLTRTSCIVKFDKDQMQYGPLRTNTLVSHQCWLLKEQDKYKKCAFGVSTKGN